MRIVYITIMFMFMFPFTVFAEKIEKKYPKPRIGFVYVSPVNDGGWAYSHDLGRSNLEQNNGIRTTYVENVAQNKDAERIIKTMALSGTDIIFATSVNYTESTLKISKQFLDVDFMICGGFKFADNVSSYYGRMYQARYLTGIVAGAMSKSENIGYVAAFPVPEIIRGINAFILGVQSVNPDAKVTVLWTNSWYNPRIEKKSAQRLVNLGCDVLAQHQDTGSVQEIAEKSKIYSIGYHSDMSHIAPNAHLTAAVWNWKPIYEMMAEKISDNTWVHGSYWFGIDTGIIDFSPFNKVVPQSVRDKVNQVKSRIISGDFTIFEGPIKDQDAKIRVPKGVKLTDDDLLNMMWFVDGVVGDID